MSIVSTPAVILVGGMGTRLQSVVKMNPKPLASLGDKSFLELLVRQLRNHGIRKLILCTGYLAEQIESKFGDGHDWDVEIKFSKEVRPLGTAGAVKLAQQHLADAADFLVMNGDSFLEVDLHRLLQFHRKHGGLVSMAVVQNEDASRYGTVHLDADDRVTGFLEKAGSKLPGLVNGGVYVFDRRVFDYIPEGFVSLEKDVFPLLIGKGVYALKLHGKFIDIGTPEDYERAQQIRNQLYEAALSKGDSKSEREEGWRHNDS